MQELIDCLLAGNEKVSLRERLVFRFDTVGKLRYIIDLENLVGNRRFSHVRECLEYVKEYFADLHPREPVESVIDFVERIKMADCKEEAEKYKKLYAEVMEKGLQIIDKLKEAKDENTKLKHEIVCLNTHALEGQEKRLMYLNKYKSAQAQCELLRSEKEFLKENNTKFAKSHAKMVCDNFNLEAKADNLEATLKEEEEKSEYWMGQTDECRAEGIKMKKQVKESEHNVDCLIEAITKLKEDYVKSEYGKRNAEKRIDGHKKVAEYNFQENIKTKKEAEEARKEFDACKVRYYELAGLNEELKTKLKMHEQRVFKGCPQ